MTEHVWFSKTLFLRAGGKIDLVCWPYFTDPWSEVTETQEIGLEVVLSLPPRLKEIPTCIREYDFFSTHQQLPLTVLWAFTHRDSIQETSASILECPKDMDSQNCLLDKFHGYLLVDARREERTISLLIKHPIPITSPATPPPKNVS